MPFLTLAQVPSLPETLFTWRQLWQEPLQAESQHTFSTQNPLLQSRFTPHFLPSPHLLLQPPPPPQSTSVSVPSLVMLLHPVVPPQLSGQFPQVALSCAQLLGQHAHCWGMPHPAG